jgi:hypothetical protein
MDINSIKDQYTCLICQNIFKNPVKLTGCGHIFCKDCIDSYSIGQGNTSSPTCPLCRAKFQNEDVVPENSLRNEMNKKKVKCECGKQMFLSEYSTHSDNCQVILNQMKLQMENKNIKIQKDKVQKNRQTFDCTLCSKKNFDRVGYIDHIKKFHPRDRGVCSICKCQPWGDPNYKTHIFAHINMRHKFDYDTVVDYNDDEDEILKKVLLESMNDK